MRKPTVKNEAVDCSTPEVVERAAPEERARVLDHILPVSPRRLGLLNDGSITSSLQRYEVEQITAPIRILSLIMVAYLRMNVTGDRWRSGLWCWVLGLLAFASSLGAVAHGFEISPATREALWRPLYLSLGILVALFLVGAVYDWRGRLLAGRLIPWGIGAGVAFVGLTALMQGAFIVFVVYEAVAMLSALAIYAYLATTGRLRGAGVISLSIVVNLVAAVCRRAICRYRSSFLLTTMASFTLSRW